ncbi:MAG: high-potential iron-sulfur protein [Xanthomonadales bacterium]|nr:high-potential iron-sulfur protein [Xanthomonadales bacterium]
MKRKLTRRQFSQLCVGLASSAAIPSLALAEDLPKLEESDAQASALGYHHDAAKVDTSEYPVYQEGSQCANCMLFQGAADAEWGPCGIFPGKQVKASGWCTAWAKKG